MTTFQIIKQVLLEIWSRFLSLFKTTPEETPAIVTQPLQGDSSIPEKITPEDLRMAVELGKLAVQRRRQIKEDFAKESAEIAAEILTRKSLELVSKIGTFKHCYSISDIFIKSYAVEKPKGLSSYPRMRESINILDSSLVFWNTLVQVLEEVYSVESVAYLFSNHPDKDPVLIVKGLIETEEAGSNA